MCLIKLFSKIKAENAERAYYRELWEETPHYDVIFHRKDGKWYIDLPGVEEEKCRLIGGSEIFMDEYADFVNYDDDGNKPEEVKMEVYSGQIPEWNVRFMRDTEEKGGYRYMVGDGFYWIFADSDSKVLPGFELWLGKGVEQIFGTAPDFLYVSLKYA